MSRKRILRLGLLVRDGRVLPVVIEYEYEERDKTFSLAPVEKDGLLGKLERLDKKKFMVVDSNYREDSSVVSYFIYCFPEDKTDCFDSLIERIKKRLDNQIAGLQKELTALEKFRAERK